jgi:hypothetical protein
MVSTSFYVFGAILQWVDPCRKPPGGLKYDIFPQNSDLSLRPSDKLKFVAYFVWQPVRFPSAKK